MIEEKKVNTGLVVLIVLLLLAIIVMSALMKQTKQQEVSEGKNYNVSYTAGSTVKLKDGSEWIVLKDSSETDDYVTVLGKEDYAVYLQGDEWNNVLYQMYHSFTEYKDSALDKFMQSKQSKIPASLKEVEGYKIRIISLDELFELDSNWEETEIAKYTYGSKNWSTVIPLGITTMTLVEESDRNIGKQWAYYTVEKTRVENSEYYIIATWKNGLGGFYPVVNIYKNSIYIKRRGNKASSFNVYNGKH